MIKIIVFVDIYKSGCTLLGSKKFKKKLEKEIKDKPIQFDNFNVELKERDKYLGQVIESNLAT